MTAAHFLCLCFDAEYSLRIGRDLPGIGCVTIQGWPRTMYGSFATLNDLVQAKLFCDPLLRAIRNSSEVSRSTSGYRRMIMKSIICLVVCSIANITFAVLITTHREALAMMFFDIAFLFQILSACEIQFNSHKETDRASLGSVMSLRGPLQRLQELQTTLPSLFDRTASEGLQMNHEIVPSYLQTASPARQ
ncbi:hypothetical protein BASA81_002858 [Batrachochytrium salamandrivorans]|nr:hypothetical protein BASA81_002858 [Batrachochytrium salamandrivorans]